MDTASIILEYIKALFWMGIILYVIRSYKHHLNRFLQRLSEESEEVSINSIGLNIKFLKNLSKLSNELPTDAARTKTDLQNNVISFAKDQFRLLCQGFFTQSLKNRIKIANEIVDISEHLSIDSILEFAESPLPGERVGAGISLGVHLEMNSELIEDRRIHNAFINGLSDKSSRVRFRFVESLMASRELSSEFNERLVQIADTDENEVVRLKANDVVRFSGS